MKFRIFLLMTMLLLFAVNADGQIQLQRGAGSSSADNTGRAAASALNGKASPGSGRDTTSVEDDPCIFPDDHRYAFTLDPYTGTMRQAAVDTSHIGLASHDIMEAQALAITHTGNLMGPHQVQDWFRRKTDHDFLFVNAYNLFASRPDEILYYNTHIPFTKATYFTSGSGNTSNDHFILDFAGNFNKRTGLGSSLNYVYARGEYQYQSAKPLKWDTYLYYTGDHYKAFLTFDLSKYANQENGGVLDRSYVLTPEAYDDNFTEAKNMATKLISTWNDMDYYNLHFSHSWDFGQLNLGRLTRRKEAEPKFRDSLTVYRDSLLAVMGDSAALRADSLALNADSALWVADSTARPAIPAPMAPDSLKAAPQLADMKPQQPPRDRKRGPEPEEEDEDDEDKPFVPVATAFNTIDFQRYVHSFRMDALADQSDTAKYYKNNYINESTTADSTTYTSFTAYAGLRINEGFAKWSQMALAAFVGYERQNYKLISDGEYVPEEKHASNTVWVGGQLSRHLSSRLTFDVTGRAALSGDKAGDTDIYGNIGTVIPFGKSDSLILTAGGFFRNHHTSYYWNHYYSNHFRWSNDFDAEQRYRVEGKIAYPRSLTEITAGIEHINNYHYFSAADGLPRQYDKQLDVVSVCLRQGIKWGILHWDNAVLFQTTSDDEVLALPKISIESDLNIRFRIAGTLYTQLGVDAYYYTKYYAPAYEPATQTFQEQHEIQCGGYPLMNAYINCNLKKIKFFVQMTNVLGTVTNDTFSGPYYPIQPMRFMYGVVLDFQN